MANRKPIDRIQDFERALAQGADSNSRYVLRLFVTGGSLRSNQAIQDIRAFCEDHLNGRYELEVVDIHQQPALARGEQIIAAPTLVKHLPDPLRKLVGNLWDVERMLVGLDLQRNNEH